MGFQDVAFLPTKSSFSTTFLKNRGRGESLVTTTCPKTLVKEKQKHAPAKYSCFNKAPFIWSVELHGDHENIAKMRQNLATPSFGNMTGFKTVVSGCIIQDSINITEVYLKHL